MGSVAETLFAAIVGSSVAQALAGHEPLARYGFLLPVTIRRVTSACARRLTRLAMVHWSASRPRSDHSTSPRFSACTGTARAAETFDILVAEAHFSLLRRGGGGLGEVTAVELPE